MAGGSANEASVLRIRLFGELDLRVGDDRLPPLESGRARSLLAHLLLHGEAAQSRQRLAFLLWPDSTEGQARTNLRHVLHTLRAASPVIERFLEVTPRTLRWRREMSCWVDVTAFEAALARAHDDNVPPGAALAARREAIQLYAGDLLEGCYEEWLDRERARLRDHYTSALARVAGGLADRGEHGEAIRVGRELLRSDPLREETYRLLMRIQVAHGDTAGAVRVYHECIATLQRELGVEPSADTKEEFAALMRPGQPRAGAEREPARLTGAVLVGRDQQWERLTACWMDAAAGRAQLVLVTGEPGIGKTRLVEDLAAWCGHRGAVVAQARSYPNEGELGYGVPIGWLRTGDLATQLRRATRADRIELARLLPELDDGEVGATPAPIDGAEPRRRLFDAVSRTLLPTGRPTLLVADDAQWCDEQSLQLIHYLVRLDPSRPLLVVGTARREDLGDVHPLGSLAGGLQAIDRCSEIALGRLARGETEELAHHLAGRALDAAIVDGLFAETEGNPLFIVEALRSGWASFGRNRSGLSPKLQAVIGTRLRQLSEPGRDLLGLAATVGREFTADVLAAASTMDDTMLVRGLDELWRRGLIREQGTDAYDFAHGRIRDVAYDSLNPASRRRNHLLIAVALLRLHARDLDAVSGEVARHHDRGGQTVEAVRWYQRAAVQAQRLHANAEAVQLLERAGELVAGLPAGVDRTNRELAVLSALPTPLAVVDGFASTRMAETQRRVLELARAVGAEPGPSLLRSVVMSRLCRNEFDGARTAASELREWAERAGDDMLVVETEYLLGIGAFWGGDFDAAQRHFQAVVHRFDAEQGAEHLLRFGHDPRVVCLSRLANTEWFLGRPDDARQTCDEAVAMAGDVGHPFSRGVAHLFAALLAVDLGEPSRYRRYMAHLRADSEHQPLQVAADVFLGYADVLDGRADDGIRRMRRAIDAHRINHAPCQRAVHLRLLVAAYDLASDAAGGLEAADETLRHGGTRIWEPEIRRLRAAFLADRVAPSG